MTAKVIVLDQVRRWPCPHGCDGSYRVAELERHLDTCPNLRGRRVDDPPEGA